MLVFTSFILLVLQAAGLNALKAEGASQKTKLEQRLVARRQKKAEELTKKEALEMKRKEMRDKHTLQVHSVTSLYIYGMRVTVAGEMSLILVALAPTLDQTSLALMGKE